MVEAEETAEVVEEEEEEVEVEEVEEEVVVTGTGLDSEQTWIRCL